MAVVVRLLQVAVVAEDDDAVSTEIDPPQCGVDQRIGATGVKVPFLGGTVELRLSVGDDGVVTLTAEGLDAELDRCLEVVLGKLELPPYLGGDIVDDRYPVTFVPP